MDCNPESEILEIEEKPLTIPKSIKDLKACRSCGLILTGAQWKENRELCPNECAGGLTRNFEGVICLMKPSQSWVARRLPLGGNPYPGLYAFEVKGD